MTLIIVTSDKEQVFRHVPQLRQLGYEVEVMTQISSDFENLISTKRPLLVMLSWELKNVDVLKQYDRIVKAHGLPCLIFTESRSRQATNSLLRCGIPNVVFPPLSAHGIHRRIHLLLRATTPATKAASSPAKKFLDPVEGKRHRRTLVESSLKAGLSSLDCKPAAEQCADNLVLIAQVCWTQSQGYLVIGCSEAKTDPAFLKKVHKVVADFIEARGEGHGVRDKNFEISLGFADLKKWAQSSAESFVVDKLGGVEVLVAFADTDSLPQVQFSSDPDFAWVDLEPWMRADAKMPFDVYVHLPENQKYILYMKRNSPLSEKHLGRLTKIGLSRCFISPNDCNSLLQHFLSPAA